MGDTYRDDVAAYDNLKNRRTEHYDADKMRTPSREGGPYKGSSDGGGDGGGGGGNRGGGGDENRSYIDAGGGGTGGGTGGYSSGGSSGGVFYGTSGGSSSGGGSGSSISARDARLIAQGENMYYSLWGEYPPTGYIKNLVSKGMNIFEIEDRERRKPSFKKTDTYQNEYMAYAKMVSSIMGTR